MDVIERAARLHHRAVEIHPFVNGNGRWGRILSNIYLRIHDSPYVAWPEALIGDASKIRDEYIRTLKAADRGEVEPFVDMHRRYLKK